MNEEKHTRRNDEGADSLIVLRVHVLFVLMSTMKLMRIWSRTIC